MAGWSSLVQGSLPCRRWASSSAQHAGHADRAAADPGLAQAHRRAVGAQEQVLVGTGRGGLPAVIGLHALAVPVEEEGATADTGGLRLDQRQHGLHGDGRVDGRAALPQDAPARFRRERVGGGGHVLLGVGRRHAGAVARGHLRRARRLGRDGRRAGHGGRRRHGGPRGTCAEQRQRRQHQRTAHARQGKSLGCHAVLLVIPKPHCRKRMVTCRALPQTHRPVHHAGPI